jgi:hypothetical protein
MTESSGGKKLACASWLSMFLSAEVFTIKCDVNSGRQGSERPATGVPRRRRPPWHGRLQGPGVGSFRSVRKDDDDAPAAHCLLTSLLFRSSSAPDAAALCVLQIGRPVLFSLAVDGEAGVRKVLQMLRDELELTMALSGCTSLREITRAHVITDSDRISRSRL